MRVSYTPVKRSFVLPSAAHMVTLRHALIARAVAIDQATYQITTIQDILHEDSLAVPSFPQTTTVMLVFWAKGRPNETFTWTLGVEGAASSIRFPLVPGTMTPSGEIHGVSPIPLTITAPGRLLIWMKFGRTEVWRRTVSVNFAPPKSPTIQ